MAGQEQKSIGQETGKSEGEMAKGTRAEAGRWLLKYGDRVYGPYSVDAMRTYIAEGRIVGQSLIAPEGTLPGADSWQAASATAPFAEFFGRAVPTPAHAPASSPAEPAQAREPAPAAAPAGSRAPYGSGKGQTDRRRQPETANFVIVMDIKARYTGPLEQAIMSLGPAYKLAPNVWCVNTNATAAGLLNDLSVHIGKTDSMFIVDATRDRTAWHNLGPETDAKIRRVWRRAF
ncbi:MAG TPA: hypothetical protein VF449_12520 [Parvibaculum sp.]